MPKFHWGEILEYLGDRSEKMFDYFVNWSLLKRAEDEVAPSKTFFSTFQVVHSTIGFYGEEMQRSLCELGILDGPIFPAPDSVLHDPQAVMVAHESRTVPATPFSYQEMLGDPLVEESGSSISALPTHPLPDPESRSSSQVFESEDSQSRRRGSSDSEEFYDALDYVADVQESSPRPPFESIPTLPVIHSSGFLDEPGDSFYDAQEHLSGSPPSVSFAMEEVQTGPNLKRKSPQAEASSKVRVKVVPKPKRKAGAHLPLTTPEIRVPVFSSSVPTAAVCFVSLPRFNGDQPLEAPIVKPFSSRRPAGPPMDPTPNASDLKRFYAKAENVQENPSSEVAGNLDILAAAGVIHPFPAVGPAPKHKLSFHPPPTVSFQQGNGSNEPNSLNYLTYSGVASRVTTTVLPVMEKPQVARPILKKKPGSNVDYFEGLE